MRVPIIAALFLAGCAGPMVTVGPDTIKITKGSGGLFSEITPKYDAWAQTGKQLVIDGDMISADAFLAFSAKGACYTDKATFQPHSVSYIGLVPNYAATKRLSRNLPRGLRDAFWNSPQFYNWVTTMHFDNAEIKALWPEGSCDNQPLKGEIK